MRQATHRTDDERLLEALSRMASALESLDEADAPADIGAHLDLAICRLKDILAERSAATDRGRSRRKELKGG